MGKMRRNVGAATVAVAAVLASLLASGAVWAGSTGGPTVEAAAIDDSVHLNQIQVIGSHNSYHQLPSPAEVAFRHNIIGPADQGLTYQHAPLPTQFSDQKVRQIELDVWLDPSGGKYANPLLRSAAGVGPYDPAMNQPGIKVFHVQDVDYASSCLSLVVCLGEVRSWSQAHPSHVPIAILIELEDAKLNLGGLPFVVPDPWTTPGLDSLDAEIRSVFSPSEMITPDDVRGSHATLDEAVTTDGWPTLGESRGKVMFLLDNDGHYRTDYLAGHPALQGRAIFTNSSPGQPDAGFVKLNNANDVAGITQTVQQGYVVRTRADADTAEARNNDTSLRDKALASGAQWVSTDYPVPGMAIGFTSPYFAALPDGQVARCNPVNAPASCNAFDLDTTTTTTTSTTTSTTVPKDLPTSSTSTSSSTSTTTTPSPTTTTELPPIFPPIPSTVPDDTSPDSTEPATTSPSVGPIPVGSILPAEAAAPIPGGPTYTG